METNTFGKFSFETFVKRTSKSDIDGGEFIAISSKSDLIKHGNVFLHREALASKGFPPKIDCVMKNIIKFVNSIAGNT